MPDIDLDFPRDVREGLMLAVVERYGPEHAALVAAFPTYRVRGAIRDLGKALALPRARSSAWPGWPTSGARSARSRSSRCGSGPGRPAGAPSPS